MARSKPWPRSTRTRTSLVSSGRRSTLRSWRRALNSRTMPSPRPCWTALSLRQQNWRSWVRQICLGITTSGWMRRQDVFHKCDHRQTHRDTHRHTQTHTDTHRHTRMQSLFPTSRPPESRYIQLSAHMPIYVCIHTQGTMRSEISEARAQDRNVVPEKITSFHRHGIFLLPRCWGAYNMS